MNLSSVFPLILDVLSPYATCNSTCVIGKSGTHPGAAFLALNVQRMNAAVEIISLFLLLAASRKFAPFSPHPFSPPTHYVFSASEPFSNACLACCKHAFPGWLAAGLRCNRVKLFSLTDSCRRRRRSALPGNVQFRGFMFFAVLQCAVRSFGSRIALLILCAMGKAAPKHSSGRAVPDAPASRGVQAVWFCVSQFCR